LVCWKTLSPKSAKSLASGLKRPPSQTQPTLYGGDPVDEVLKDATNSNLSLDEMREESKQGGVDNSPMHKAKQLPVSLRAKRESASPPQDAVHPEKRQSVREDRSQSF